MVHLPVGGYPESEGGNGVGITAFGCAAYPPKIKKAGMNPAFIYTRILPID